MLYDGVLSLSSVQLVNDAMDAATQSTAKSGLKNTFFIIYSLCVWFLCAWYLTFMRLVFNLYALSV